ncbi:hypothetical protein BH11PSE11_BH11PSE11_27440 [soil metagenome]
MKWEGNRESDNVEDRRGESSGSGIAFGGGSIGIGSSVVAIAASGHHAQNLMGISQKVQEARRRASPTQANALSVRLELQADCFAGVWANHANETRYILQNRDFEAVPNVATAIGYEALRRQARGHVVTESITHGSSRQRVRSFKRGIDSGQVKPSNTFEQRAL